MQGIDPAMLQQLMGGQAGGMGGPPPPLAKFKAGRCDFKEKDGGPTLTITPSKRKGLIMCTKDESGMTHFQWKDRESNSVVEDVIVMPRWEADAAGFPHFDESNCLLAQRGRTVAICRPRVSGLSFEHLFG